MLGAVANIGMLIAVIALGIVSGGATMIPALIAIGVTVVWLFIGVVFCALATGAEFGYHKLTAFYSNSNNEPDSN